MHHPSPFHSPFRSLYTPVSINDVHACDCHMIGRIWPLPPMYLSFSGPGELIMQMKGCHVSTTGPTPPSPHSVKPGWIYRILFHSKYTYVPFQKLEYSSLDESSNYAHHYVYCLATAVALFPVSGLGTRLPLQVIC